MKRFLKFKLNRQHVAFAVVLVAMLYIAITTLNIIARNYQLQQRLDELAAQNEILELQNQQLRYEITYYKTDAFVEKEARAKLGLQAPGEHVVIFPDQIPGPAEPPQPEPKQSLAETAGDNFREWVFFLFHIEG